jgi:uncharacterized protein YhbP (UPF0306 family)
MTDLEIEQQIRDYLPQIIHMSVATVGEGGKPWVFEVHYAYDGDLNLYWVSEQTARHSQELVVNPDISGNIVVQHQPDQKGLGVSYEGRVEILQDITESSPEYQVYIGRFPLRADPVRAAYVEKTETGRRIYKVVVSDWYLAGIIDGKMQKLHLKKS